MSINIQKIQRALRMAQRLGDADTYAHAEILRSAETALDGTDVGAVRYLGIIAGCDVDTVPAALHPIIHSARALLARTTENP